MTSFVRELPTTDQMGHPVARGSALYMGEPDGPLRFVKSLGIEVPTYIDPRDDLKSTYKSASAHKSIDYHVPPKMRGPYLATQLADYDAGNHYPLTQTGKVRCGGLRADGNVCQKAAMNRTPFCTNHGGALHPADKIFSSQRGIMPSNREKLSRLQKVEMGMIPVRELTDEEIARFQVKQDDGTFSKTTPALSARIIAEMRQEFFNRADEFARVNTMDMLKEMRKIAMSPVAEDKDKIQAIQWMTERVLGKTPEVVLTSKLDSPFEQMMTEIVSGSRDDYRNAAPALPGGMNVIEGEVIPDVWEDEEDDQSDAESIDEPEMASETQVVDNSDRDAESRELTPEEVAQQRKEMKARIQANRNRKYAAKSRGFDTLDNLPYEIEFKTAMLKSGPVTRMKLIAPSAQKAPKAR